MNIERTEIKGDWQVAERLPKGRDFFLPDGGEKTWLPAEVPGHVHLDLMRAGVITDPFQRMQERACQWVDEADWTYRTTFTVSSERLASRGEHGRHFLHFHGLDTIARIYLNGEQVGSAENFHVPHRFDVTETLKDGENTLRVEFDSALRVGRERAQAYLGDGTTDRGAMSYFNFGPRAFVRKPQYMFGWDWGPELVSCGLWEKVELVTVPIAEILDWRYDYTFTDDTTANVRFTIEIERHDLDAALTLSFSLGGANNPGPRIVAIGSEKAQIMNQDVPTGRERVTVTVNVDIESVQRWYPNGDASGEATRYGGQIFLNKDGKTIARKRFSIGFRTVELVREPDADGQGESFKFRINGVDTYIKGANWIPLDTFPARKQWLHFEDGAAPIDKRIHQTLRQVRDAGFNMLRIWGGGLYETEEFYDLCDRLGILVWQDFGFACSMYPDDLPDFREAVRDEAIVAVKRIRNHPCLALWCGGNENLQLAQQRWAGPTQAQGFFGKELVHDVLPAVLAEYDPATPYWPNSPYSGEPDLDSQSDDRGDAHYWNVWHGEGDWVHYRKNFCRFSSEFGFAAPAGHAAWDSCLAPEDKAIHAPALVWHDKTRKGWDTFLGYVALHYPAPQTFDDLIYYGQCNQADALTCGVEHWRRLKGRCWGTLFWQFNDCWPTHSWAVVDSLNEPKLAYYAAKRFYAPLLLSLVRRSVVTTHEGPESSVVPGVAPIEPEGDMLLAPAAIAEEGPIDAHLINDTLADVPGHLTLRLLTFHGEEIARRERATTAPANAASGRALSLPVGDAPDPTRFVHATFTSDDGTLLAENFLLLDEPKNLQLPPPLLTWQITKMTSQEGYEIQRAKGQYHPYPRFKIILQAERFAGSVHLRFDGYPAPPTLSDNGFHLLPGRSHTVYLTDEPHGTTAAQLTAALRIRHL